jgi:sec-independent protein translocase protein TatB
MNGTIFGIGPLEVLVIGILILLIFGPQRLPEFTRGLGTALRKMRETYVAFTQEFRGELEPIAQDIESVTSEIRKEVDAIREAADIRSILKPYADDVNKAMSLKEITPATPMPTPTPMQAPQKAATIDDIIKMNTPAPNGSATASAPSNSTNSVAQKPAASTNGKVGAATMNGKANPAKPSYALVQPVGTVDVNLTSDNPWANIGAPVRTDKLDDDSPWRL